VVGGQLGQDGDETSSEDGEAATATPEPARFFPRFQDAHQYMFQDVSGI
jgi:hypothetical protein